MKHVSCSSDGNRHLLIATMFVTSLSVGCLEMEAGPESDEESELASKSEAVQLGAGAEDISELPSRTT